MRQACYKSSVIYCDIFTYADANTAGAVEVAAEVVKGEACAEDESAAGVIVCPLVVADGGVEVAVCVSGEVAAAVSVAAAVVVCASVLVSALLSVPCGCGSVSVNHLGHASFPRSAISQ